MPKLPSQTTAECDLTPHLQDFHFKYYLGDEPTAFCVHVQHQPIIDHGV
jgi:hypothetical protein